LPLSGVSAKTSSSTYRRAASGASASNRSVTGVARVHNRPIDTPSTPQSPPPASRLDRLIELFFPLEGTNDMVYGLLLIGAILAAEGGRHETYEMTLTATVVAALLAWLAHAYSTLFGRRIEEAEHMTLDSLLAAMRRDAVLLRGGAVPIVVLFICWALGVEQETGVTIAASAVIAAIILLEVVAALLAQLKLREFLVEVCVGAVYGTSIFLLKLLAH